MNSPENTIMAALMASGHTLEEAKALLNQFTNDLAEDLALQGSPKGSYGGEKYGYYAAIQRLDRTGEHFYWEHVAVRKDN